MRRVYSIWAGVVLGIASLHAAAQTKTVTLLVPFSAGGTVDIVARQLSKDLSTQLGQNVVVDNKPGAGGTMASSLLARAAPDGLTLMVMHQGVAFNPKLYDKLPFDTRRDLVPVAVIGSTPNAFVATRSLPVNSLSEFLVYARAHPGELSYASGGVGSSSHVAMESLMSVANIKMTHIPYKGGGAALTDLIGGRVQVMLQSLASLKGAIDNKQLKALATSGLQRNEALPSVPTIDESGLKGFEFLPWYGVFAPPGTPAALLDRIHDAVNASLRNPENKRALALQGMDLTDRSRKQFTDLYLADLDHWGKVIESLNIKGE